MTEWTLNQSKPVAYLLMGGPAGILGLIALATRNWLAIALGAVLIFWNLRLANRVTDEAIEALQEVKARHD